MGVLTVFFALALAHLIADFPLQTEWVYQLKIRSQEGLLVHVAVHLAMTALLLELRGRDALLLLILGVTHYGLDWLKVRVPFRPRSAGFVMDQMAHTFVLLALAALWPSLTVRLPLSLLVVALVLASIPAWLMFAWIVSCDVLDYRPNAPAAKTWHDLMFRLSKQWGLSIAMLLAVCWLLVVFWFSL